MDKHGSAGTAAWVVDGNSFGLALVLISVCSGQNSFTDELSQSTAHGVSPPKDDQMRVVRDRVGKPTSWLCRVLRCELGALRGALAAHGRQPSILKLSQQHGL